MIIFLEDHAFLAGFLIVLVLFIGALVYRLLEKEDEFEDRPH